MSMITIASRSYEVYGDINGALQYIGGIFQPGATAFMNATTDLQGKLLVSARTMIDEAEWQGVATLVSTTLQWPRTGVYDKDGNAVSSATVPTNIVNAEYELAIAIAGDPTLYAAIGGSPIRSLHDGPTSVSWFRPPGGNAIDADEFPLRVARLVNQYLKAYGPRSTSYQNDGETNKGNFADSTFGGTQDDTYKRSGPL